MEHNIGSQASKFQSSRLSRSNFKEGWKTISGPKKPSEFRVEGVVSWSTLKENLGNKSLVNYMLSWVQLSNTIT